MKEEIKTYIRPKWLPLTLIILYFFAGQVYPYLHIHHHSPHQKKEIDFCIHHSEQETHFHQCCGQHRFCQIKGESDWHIVTIKVKDLKKTTPDLIGFFPPTDNLKSRLSVITLNKTFIHKKFRISSKLFNKAPPGVS